MAVADPHAITPDDTPSTDHLDGHRVYVLGSHKVHVGRTTRVYKGVRTYVHGSACCTCADGWSTPTHPDHDKLIHDIWTHVTGEASP